MRSTCCLAVCLFLALLAYNSSAEEQPSPIGYYVETKSIDFDQKLKDEDAVPDSEAYCIRNGEKFDVVEGMPVLPGDIVETTAKGAVAIAFLDNSAVTLRASTRVKVDDYSYPARKAPTVLTVELGRAFFDIAPRPAQAQFTVKTLSATVAPRETEVAARGVVMDPAKFLPPVTGTPTAVQFEVFSSMVNGNYETVVGVSKGTATLQLNSTKTGLEVLSGSKLLVTVMNPNVPGWDQQPASVTKGNLSKEDIKLLKSEALQDIQISFAINNTVKIKSMSHNCDGTVTFIKMTEVNGKRTQISTTVLGSNNVKISKIDEKGTTKSLQIIDGTLKITEKLKAGIGTITIKDSATKLSYKGTVTTLANGAESGIATAKDGSKIYFTRKVNADGSKTEIRTLFVAGSTTGTQTMRTFRSNCDVEVVVTTVSGAQLPDGSFSLMPGTVPTTPAQPPPVGPDSPVAFTPTTVLGNDPTPVSP
jgi:hypothetical protein